jgi:hypothetical protein
MLSKNGLMLSKNGLMLSKNGLMLSKNGLMLSKNGLMFSLFFGKFLDSTRHWKSHFILLLKIQ